MNIKDILVKAVIVEPAAAAASFAVHGSMA